MTEGGFYEQKVRTHGYYRAEDDNGYQEGNDWVTEKVQSYQGQVTKLDPWGLRRL